MSYQVDIEIDGQSYSGSYQISAGRRPRELMVTSSRFGTRTTEVGDTPPNLLARMLLRELVLKGLHQERRQHLEPDRASTAARD
jgi:hypothetical protein